MIWPLPSPHHRLNNENKIRPLTIRAMEPCYEWTFNLYQDIESLYPDDCEPELPPLAKLCGACTTFFGTPSQPTSHTFGLNRFWNQKFSQMKESALDGCQFCSLQIESFTKEELERLQHSTSVRVTLARSQRNHESMHFTYQIKQMILASHNLRIIPLDGTSYPHSWIFLLRMFLVKRLMINILRRSFILHIKKSTSRRDKQLEN